MSTFLFILFICCGIIAAIVTKKLTASAAFIGGAIGVLLFIGAGWVGIILMGAFFLMATVATAWKKRLKQKLVLTQEHGPRDTGQVLANGGVAAICGLLSIIFPSQRDLYILLVAGAFSSATADTVSSELGTVYGRRFYDILSLKKAQRGLDGVISVEGILFGIMGSVIIAAIYALFNIWDERFFWIVAAGTIGNLADSFLGATLERKRMIGNNAVNFLNTAIAAITILLVWGI